MDKSSRTVAVEGKRGGLRPLVDEGDVVQGLWGCPPFCSWAPTPHEHVLIGTAELALSTVTDEVLEVRHATDWALAEVASGASSTTIW